MSGGKSGNEGGKHSQACSETFQVSTRLSQNRGRKARMQAECRQEDKNAARMQAGRPECRQNADRKVRMQPEYRLEYRMDRCL